MKDHLQIGEIYREHGLKGLCKVYVYSMDSENLIEGQTYVLKSLEGKICKTILQSVSVGQKFFLVQFDCFSGADQILPWRKASLWLPKVALQKTDQDVYDFEWEDFRIFDAQHKEVGVVQRIEHTPLMQFVVDVQGRDVLIPYVPAWIVSCDAKNKTLVLDLPEGLL